MTIQHKRMRSTLDPEYTDPVRGRRGGSGRKKRLEIRPRYIESLRKSSGPNTAGGFLRALNSYVSSGNKAQDRTFFRMAPNTGLMRLKGTEKEEAMIAAGIATSDPSSAAIEQGLVAAFQQMVEHSNDPKSVRAAKNYSVETAENLTTLARLEGHGSVDYEGPQSGKEWEDIHGLGQKLADPKNRWVGSAGLGRGETIELFTIDRVMEDSGTKAVKGKGKGKPKSSPELAINDVLRELQAADPKNRRSTYNSVSVLDELYSEAAKREGIPPALVQTVGWYESRHGTNKNDSVAGARGVMQFIPTTGKQFGLITKADFMDPKKSIDAGAKYLGQLYREYEHLGEERATKLALMAYNWGPGNVKSFVRYGHGIKYKRNPSGALPKETARYIRHIPALMRASNIEVALRRDAAEPPKGAPAAPVATPAIPELVPLGSTPPPAEVTKSPQDLAIDLFMGGGVPDAGPPIEPEVFQSTEPVIDAGVVPPPTDSLGVPLNPQDVRASIDPSTDWLDEEVVVEEPLPTPATKPKRKKPKKADFRKQAAAGRGSIAKQEEAGKRFAALPKSIKNKWTRAKPRKVRGNDWIAAYFKFKGNIQKAKDSFGS